MSSVIRKLQREKSKKPRLRHRHKKGPATAQRLAPPARVVPTPEDGKPDMTKVDPGCNRCHGSGWWHTIVAANGHRTRLICACVARGMAGGATWMMRVEG